MAFVCRRLLLEVGRSTEDFENARAAFKSIKLQLGQVVHDGYINELRRLKLSSEKLQRASQILEIESFQAVAQDSRNNVIEAYVDWIDYVEVRCTIHRCFAWSRLNI